MNKFLKNKNAVIFAGVGVLVVVLLIVAALVFNKPSNQANQNANVYPTQAVIPTIKPEEIGLVLKWGVEGKTVITSVSKTEGISSIEYELSYKSKGDIPRGAFGKFDLKQTTPKNEIDLGTCSSGVCKYDVGITDVKIVLKITKNDGKVYQSQASLAPTAE
jgi:hypothetical protein